MIFLDTSSSVTWLFLGAVELDTDASLTVPRRARKCQSDEIRCRRVSRIRKALSGRGAPVDYECPAGRVPSGQGPPGSGGPSARRRQGAFVTETSPRVLRNFIDGEYREASSDTRSDIVNPATGRLRHPRPGPRGRDRAGLSSGRRGRRLRRGVPGLRDLAGLDAG